MSFLSFYFFFSVLFLHITGRGVEKEREREEKQYHVYIGINNVGVHCCFVLEDVPQFYKPVEAFALIRE